MTAAGGSFQLWTFHCHPSLEALIALQPARGHFVFLASATSLTWYKHLSVPAAIRLYLICNMYATLRGKLRRGLGGGRGPHSPFCASLYSEDNDSMTMIPNDLSVTVRVHVCVFLCERRAFQVLGY